MPKPPLFAFAIAIFLGTIAPDRGSKNLLSSGFVPSFDLCYTRLPSLALPMDIEAIYQRGFQLRCDGRYGEARIEFQKVIAANPGHMKARHQLGLIQGFEGDFDGSIATLQAIVNQYPRDLEVRYDLAMTQMMLGMQDEACANFNYILAIDPTHEKANQQSIYC